MSFTELRFALPDLAEKETRSLIIQQQTKELPNVKPGGYHFVEMFCTDQSCDCRRAMIRVIDDKANLMATLSYGWESPKFYSDWMGGDDEFGKHTSGAHVYPMQPQGKNYLEFADFFQRMIAEDKGYQKRIIRHYNQFRLKFRNSKKLKKKLLQSQRKQNAEEILRPLM